jgi:hypothetical protein
MQDQNSIRVGVESLFDDCTVYFHQCYLEWGENGCGSLQMDSPLAREESRGSDRDLFC